jgi:hypothetical protein
MSSNTIFKLISETLRGSSRTLLSPVFFTAFLLGLVFAASAHEPREIDPPVPSDPSPRTAIDRSGVIQTKDGLTLHLTTDLGSVRIVALEPGAPLVVRYTVHIETDAREPLAKSLLDRYALTAKTTYSGVEINGASPTQAGRTGANAQFYVHYEVAVPAGYSLDTNTGVGDIETQDIGGTATPGRQHTNGRIGFTGCATYRRSHDRKARQKAGTSRCRILWAT